MLLKLWQCRCARRLLSLLRLVWYGLNWPGSVISDFFTHEIGPWANDNGDALPQISTIIQSQIKHLDPFTNIGLSLSWHRQIITWWRHQMETFSALLALCAGNSPPPVNSPHKGKWRGASIFSLICARINGWVNNGEAGDLRHHRAHYGITVVIQVYIS